MQKFELLCEGDGRELSHTPSADNIFMKIGPASRPLVRLCKTHNSLAMKTSISNSCILITSRQRVHAHEMLSVIECVMDDPKAGKIKMRAVHAFFMSEDSS
jgi:hypothetical protein